jgi:transposase-like protein
LDPITLPTYSKKFKIAAMARVQAGEPVALVARSLDVKRQNLYRWMKALDKLGSERAFSGRGYWQANRNAAAPVNVTLHERRGSAARTLAMPDAN